jgi:hypothetical protein
MICGLCTTDISGGAQATAPCCNSVFHTVCMITRVTEICSNAYYTSTVDIPCTCGSILYTQYQHGINEIYEAASADAATLLATPVVKADLKALKKKQTAMTKARTAFAKILRDKTVAFKAATEPHIEQINNIKSTMNAELKGSAEYKESLKCRRVYESTLNAFKTKHNMSRNVLREVMGSNAYYRYRYSNDSARMLIRRFRIRI